MGGVISAFRQPPREERAEAAVRHGEYVRARRHAFNRNAVMHPRESLR
jgi:hypothetical protein